MRSEVTGRSFSTEIGNFQEFPTKSNFVKISEMKTCHPKLDLKSRASKNEISFEKKWRREKLEMKHLASTKPSSFYSLCSSQVRYLDIKKIKVLLSGKF